MYCTLVRHKEWRGSTFHFIFGKGSAWLDIKCNEQDGSDAKTTNCSFDGAGCLGISIDFPADLANILLHRVPKQKDSVDIDESDEVAQRIKDFYTSNLFLVPEIWREDFVKNGVIDEQK